MNLTQKIFNIGEQSGAITVMKQLGIHSGQISQAQARRTYGKWFTDHDKSGKIRPCRIEEGHAGTRWYDVIDILAVMKEEAVKAQLRNL